MAKRAWRIQPRVMNTPLQPTSIAPRVHRTGSRRAHHDAGRGRAPGRSGRPTLDHPATDPASDPEAGSPTATSSGIVSVCQVPSVSRSRGGNAPTVGRPLAGRLGAAMGLFNKILHAGEGRKLKSLETIAPVVGGFEAEMEARSDDDLRALTPRWREQLDQAETADAKQEHLDDLLPEAFAAVREAGRRTLGQRHFDVQLMGGAALHFGWVAEMKTGEGKTLVATLPAYLNALERRRGPPRHRERLPRPPRRRVDGPALPVPRARRRRRDPRRRRLRGEAAAYAAGHHLRHQQRVRLRLPARQHGGRARRPGATQPRVRHRRRGRLDPDRRSAHPAHHLGTRRRRPGALRTSSPPS